MGLKLDAEPPASHANKTSGPSGGPVASEQSSPACSVDRFTAQCYSHIVLATSASTATLALRLGQLLAAMNRELNVGVIASPLSPRSLSCLNIGVSTSAPANITVLADPVDPKLICAGSGDPRVQGVQLDTEGKLMAGCQREVVVCCDPTESAETIAAMMDNCVASAPSPRPDFRRGLGRGLPAGVRDLRIAPIHTWHEADVVAGWVFEEWLKDPRR